MCKNHEYCLNSWDVDGRCPWEQNVLISAWTSWGVISSRLDVVWRHIPFQLNQSLWPSNVSLYTSICLLHIDYIRFALLLRVYGIDPISYHGFWLKHRRISCLRGPLHMWYFSWLQFVYIYTYEIIPGIFKVSVNKNETFLALTSFLDIFIWDHLRNFIRLTTVYLWDFFIEFDVTSQTHIFIL